MAGVPWLAVACPSDLTLEEAERLKNEFEATLPGHKIIVVSNCSGFATGVLPSPVEPAPGADEAYEVTS
jgi:hypothetical protein